MTETKNVEEKKQLEAFKFLEMPTDIENLSMCTHWKQSKSHILNSKSEKTYVLSINDTWKCALFELSDLPVLKILNLTGCRFPVLIQNCPKLESLFVSDFAFRGRLNLGKLPSLKYLEIGDCVHRCIQTEEVQKPKDISTFLRVLSSITPNLITLDFSLNVHKNLSDSYTLIGFQNLTSVVLCFDDCHINDEEAESVYFHIKDCPKLETVSFHSAYRGPQTVVKIHLKNLASLHTLNCRGFVTDYRGSEESSSSLTLMLEDLPKLETFQAKNTLLVAPFGSTPYEPIIKGLQECVKERFEQK